MNKIRQNSKQLDLITRRIVDAVRPERIILFGSQTRENPDPDCDYDIVVVYDGPKSKRELDIEIHRLFHPPEFSLDVFVLSSEELQRFKHVANTLEHEASENGVILYG